MRKFQHIYLQFLLTAVFTAIGVSVVQAQPQDIRFGQITVEDGLSQSIVYSIVQDFEGYLWFGTRDGLNRYDGNTFKIYRPRAQDPTSLSDGKILAVFEDRDLALWVGTMAGGLNKFDRATESFTHYRHDATDPTTLGHDRVTAIVQDTTGMLWVGTDGGGLNKLDPATGRFTRFDFALDDPGSVGGNFVKALFTDQAGNVWVGAHIPGRGGLCKIDLTDGTCESRFISGWGVDSITEEPAGVLWVSNVKTETEFVSRLSRFEIESGRIEHYRYPFDADFSSMVMGYDGLIWSGSRGYSYGLQRFNQETEEFSTFRHDSDNPTSLSEDRVSAMLVDRSGLFWIGTASGISVFKPRLQQFALFDGHSSNANSLSDNRVNGMYEDRNGYLWVGTHDGLNRINRSTGRVTQYFQDSSAPGASRANSVWRILEDQRGTLWIGTGGSGLFSFDRRTARFQYDRSLERAELQSTGPNTLPRPQIRGFLEDQRGHLWIGTQRGLFVRNPVTGQAVHYRSGAHPDSLSNSKVNYIHQDDAGLLWIGTDLGLNTLNLDTKRFTRFLHDPADSLSLSANIIWSMTEDPTTPGVLWIGTVGGGLNRFDKSTRTFQRYTTADGLANDDIYSLFSDDKGTLWMSTNRGLSRFHIASQSFTNYDEKDGLQGGEFALMSHHKNKNGELFFGGVNGFNSFHPDSIYENPTIPPVVITSFRKFDQDVPGMVSSGDVIELSHEENFFTFDLAALDYTAPLKNQYRYRLDGLDEGWRSTDGRRPYATYTGVPPGKYTFSVQASNSDGVWNENGASVQVAISPPWFRTFWAYGLYAIIGLFAAFFADRSMRRRLIQKERDRSLKELEGAYKELDSSHHELEETHRELGKTYEDLVTTQRQLVQSEKMASLGHLTAGIAHEIKNPLNFVTNFAEVAVDLADELQEEIKKDTDRPIAEVADDIEGIVEDLKAAALHINEHGRRADEIVKSMMQHARGGAGHPEATDVNPFVEQYVLLSFHGMRAKHVDFNVTIERAYGESVGEVEMVPQDVGRVLINLLNNALYAVQEKAVSTDDTFVPTVVVSTRRDLNNIEIRVKDNGPGISKSDREKIFEPFFTTKPTGSGTGLGLSLSYDIVVQGHGGMLSVESEEGEGATFIVTLPDRIT